MERWGKRKEERGEKYIGEHIWTWEERREGDNWGEMVDSKRREGRRHKGTVLLFFARNTQYNQSGPHDNCPGFWCTHISQQHASIINRLEIRYGMWICLKLCKCTYKCHMQHTTTTLHLINGPHWLPVLVCHGGANLTKFILCWEV